MNKCEQYCRTIQRMCNSGGGGLPSEYQQVEYLESTSAKQYIDTQVVIPDEYERVECKLYVVYSYEGSTRYFGSYNYIGTRASIVPCPYNSHGPIGGIRIGSSTTVDIGGSTARNTAYTIDLTADNGTLVGTCCGYNIDATYSGTIVTDKVETFFSQDGSSFFGGRVYYYRLYTSAGLVRDMVPCYRKSDSKPGFYDLVTNTFFINAGGGEFTVGPDIN